MPRFEPSGVVEAGLFTIGETALPDWQLEQFPEYRAARALNALGPPALAAVGVTGNVMVLVVLTCSPLRRSACCRYLATIAIADIVLLTMNLFFNFVDVFLHKLRVSDGVCKMYYFVFFTSAHLSAWLLVAVTAQRCVVIRRPMTSHFVTSSRCTILVIGGLVGGSVTLNLHHLVVRELPASDENTRVGFHTVTISSNININSSSSSNSNSIPATSRIVNSINRSVNNQPPAAHQERGSRNVQSRQLTLMPLLASAVFVALSTPIAVVLLVEQVAWDRTTPRQVAVYTLLRIVVNTLMFTNHAVNFLLYCFAGSTFRHHWNSTASRLTEN
nr:hypothetical protein BaRGS_025055 [Batillaria attramentaria]